MRRWHEGDDNVKVLVTGVQTFFFFKQKTAYEMIW